ncbi:MAG: hypothetical protein M3N02_02670, partial [Pseudomonadota bacterium]|nr:hypothetical protein [Pseudomonadota bacterium]
VYDSAPLAVDVELLGVPNIRLRLAADRPAAQVAVRVCKVLPDGTSWRIGYGLLDLTHRNGHAAPEPVVPGKAFNIALDLGFLAQRLQAGERLRVAISEGLWPLVWPSPDSPTLTLYPDASAITLPIRAAPLVEPAMPIATVDIAADAGAVKVTTDIDGDAIRVSGVWPDTRRTSAHGTILSGFGPNTDASIVRDKPNTCRWTGEKVSRYRRGDWDCSLRITFAFVESQSSWVVDERIEAFQNGKRVFDRPHRTVIARGV